MTNRAVIVGSSNNFLIYFTKYLILNNIEIYLVIKKDEEITILKELEKDVTVIRFDGNIEYLKLLLKSIEPSVIYNLSTLDINDIYDIKDLIAKNYSDIILILEALTEAKNTKLVNLMSKCIKDKDENPLNLYSAVEKSLDNIIEYYKKIHGIDVLIKYKTNDINLNMDMLLN